MTFRVETTAAAEQDADAFSNGCCPNMPETLAFGGSLALEDAIASLVEFPERCPSAPENASSLLKCAICSMANHRMSIGFCSRSRTKLGDVLHIRHGGRRQPLKQ